MDKKVVITAVVCAAVVLLAYNKVAVVKKALGGA